MNLCCYVYCYKLVIIARINNIVPQMQDSTKSTVLNLWTSQPLAFMG